MIVVDTSVWIDVLGGRRTRKALRCVELIEGGEPVALTDVIFTEVLQGLRSDAEARACRAAPARVPDPSARGPRRLRPCGPPLPHRTRRGRDGPQDARLPDRSPVRADRRSPSARGRGLRSSRVLHAPAHLQLNRCERLPPWRSRPPTTTRPASRSGSSTKGSSRSRARPSRERREHAAALRGGRPRCAGCSATSRAGTPTCTAASSSRPTTTAPTSACCSGTRTATPRRAGTARSRSAPGRSSPAA